MAATDARPSIDLLKQAFNSVEVDISVSARDILDRDLLSKSDPKCVLYTKRLGSQEFVKYDETEEVTDNLNPTFVKKFRLTYFVREKQELLFKLYDVDVLTKDFLGEVTCLLSDIYRQQRLELPLLYSGNKKGQSGVLILHAFKVGDRKDQVTFNFKAEELPKMDRLGSGDPYLIIKKEIKLNSRQFIPVARTEVVKNTHSPTWQPLTLDVDTLCANDYNNRILIECLDWDRLTSDDLVGSFLTDLTSLTQDCGPDNYQKTFQFNKNGEDRGKLILTSCDILQKFSFYDYVSSKTHLNFVVAIDFTDSNGNQSDPDSRHFSGESGQSVNTYMKVMEVLGEVIPLYDPKNFIHAIGFGAILSPSDSVSHNFNLDSECQPLDGMVAVNTAYRTVLENAILASPVEYCPVINHVIERSREQIDGSEYFVLFILTNTSPDDKDDTEKALQEASGLPLSISIINVGDEDNAGIEEFSSPSDKNARDVITCTRVKDYQDGDGEFISKDQFAHAMFRKIPEQLLSWMTHNNIKPE
ncbi:copine-8-like isoform X2 [Ptychodera flava]|uniref:copine-8-like isoform X2 n=1 Tax=Ptychodera flava TaxID=63121 RepID=UPI00396A89EC